MVARFLIVLLVCCHASLALAARDVHVFAAASLADAVEDIRVAYGQVSGLAVVPVLAGSSTLARQIEAGAGADIFISADEEWMDYLTARDFIEKPSRHSLLSNELVLVMPKDAVRRLSIAKGSDWLAMVPKGHIAVGDPAHVPVGKYARMALQSLDVWAAVRPRLARTSDTRAALALAQRGEAAAAIVYRTDVMAAGNVTVAGVFPKGSHPPISYSIALVAGNKSEEAQRVLDFICGRTAKSIFKKHGFIAK